MTPETMILYFIILGERFAFSGGNIKFNGSMESKSVLYSAIQPASSDLGCITVTYSGTNIHFKVFITNGTIEDPSDLVFHQRNVDTNHFVSTSFQTPTDTPYMVGGFHRYFFCITIHLLLIS